MIIPSRFFFIRRSAQGVEVSASLSEVWCFLLLLLLVSRGQIFVVFFTPSSEVEVSN